MPSKVQIALISLIIGFATLSLLLIIKNPNKSEKRSQLFTWAIFYSLIAAMAIF